MLFQRGKTKIDRLRLEELEDKELKLEMISDTIMVVFLTEIENANPELENGTIKRESILMRQTFGELYEHAWRARPHGFRLFSMDRDTLEFDVKGGKFLDIAIGIPK